MLSTILGGLVALIPVSVSSYKAPETVIVPQKVSAPVIEPKVVVEAKIEPITPSVEPVVDPILCSCVLYARSLGVKVPNGLDAGEFEPNTTPFVGALALLQYSNIAHIAVITKLENNGFWVKESNYKKCQKGERFIPWNDKSIRGFWKE